MECNVLAVRSAFSWKRVIAYFVGGGSSIRMKGRKAFPPKNAGRKDRKARVHSVLSGVVFDDSDFRRTANIPRALDARGNKTTAAASIKFEDTIFDCQKPWCNDIFIGNKLSYIIMATSLKTAILPTQITVSAHKFICIHSCFAL